MDVNRLMTALDNESNENIMNLTTRKIMETKISILNELQLGREKTLALLRQLKNYRYVDDLSDLKIGNYVKWIPIIDPNNIPLNYNGLICNIKITDNGVMVSCKNFMNRHYTFKMDECLIFQKLTQQELILLRALDHLEDDEDDDDDGDEDYDY
jgi:hypothetical protein